MQNNQVKVKKKKKMRSWWMGLPICPWHKKLKHAKGTNCQ